MHQLKVWVHDGTIGANIWVWFSIVIALTLRDRDAELPLGGAPGDPVVAQAVAGQSPAGGVHARARRREVNVPLADRSRS